jgi:hypothetical protein
MPYIRLYSREVSLAEKRMLAEKLIRITLGAFQLGPEERSNTTVQFVPRDLASGSFDSAFNADEPSAVLEVSHHDLTVHKIQALVEAATPVLQQSAAVPHPGRIARMLHVQADPARQVGFQFNETSSPERDAGRFALADERRAA